MGLWLNIAFVQTDDVARVRDALVALCAARGRREVTPLRRKPADADPMQYGDRDEVPRWGFAGFRGAPGWTVVRTAPFELLQLGAAPLLAEVATRVGAPAFQYNVYDGDSHLLLEARADGSVEKSGYIGNNVGRYWPREPPPDRVGVRFRVIDVEPVAARAVRDSPTAMVVGVTLPSVRPALAVAPEKRTAVDELWATIEAGSAARSAALVAWLAALGRAAPTADGVWRAHPADVVRALARDGDSFLPIEGVVEAAITSAFGGANREHCDNAFVTTTLVPHARSPVRGGFVLYTDVAS